MENPEEVLQSLDEFSKLKPKDIPRELEEYLSYVAKTGDPVYQWSVVKCLFREKLLNVITDFYETCPTIDLPPCPNVDPFNYETMKSALLERIDSFASAPFTVQRLCELLTTPRKEYSRVDKYIRAIEKNILVVSTREPGNIRRSDGMQPDFLMNGVMDGRGLDIGEAIETVSSDSVNLVHAEDSEVNVTDSIPIDCSSAEEIDMEEHSDVESTNDNVLEKEQCETTLSVQDEGVKNYEGSREQEADNELKTKSKEKAEIEVKEQESVDTPLETSSQSVPSESRDTDKDIDSTNKTILTEVSEIKATSEVPSESKSTAISEDKTQEGSDKNNISEETDSEINVTCTVDESDASGSVEPSATGSVEVPDVADSVTDSDLQENVPDQITEPKQDANVENKDNFEPVLKVIVDDTAEDSCSSSVDITTVDSVCKVSPSKNDSSPKLASSSVNTDAVLEVSSAVEAARESGKITVIPPSEGAEVVSNISPVSVSKDAVGSLEAVQNDISKVITEDTDTKDSDASGFNSQDEEGEKDVTETEVTSEESNLTMDAEQDERMEVDDISNQSPEEAMLAEEGEEPMDQSEEQST